MTALSDSDRSAIVARCYALHGALRGDPAVPQALWDLLDALVTLAAAPLSQEDTPTRPDIRRTPQPWKATAVLDELAKGKP